MLLQQQVSLLALHLRAEGSSDSTRLCLDIFQMCIGHFLLCTLHKLMIGTENSYYSNSCCCSTHPDPIWNLEATTMIIEHQIKSVLYSLLMISKQKKEKNRAKRVTKIEICLPTPQNRGDFNARKSPKKSSKRQDCKIVKMVRWRL